MSEVVTRTQGITTVEAGPGIPYLEVFLVTVVPSPHYRKPLEIELCFLYIAQAWHLNFRLLGKAHLL